MTAPDPFSPRATLQRFAETIAALRAPDGCPWDREQTHQTLVPYLIEECHECVDAIEGGDDDELCEELGDVLLQVVLHAQLAAERGAFTLQDVIDGIDAKMVRRHPHVFGDVEAASREDVADQWRKARRAEGRTTLGGLPRSLPALARAQKMIRKVTAVGFDWPDVGGVVGKLHEEVGELVEAIEGRQPDRVRDELGDVLFVAVNVAHKLGVAADEALRSTMGRFERRFGHVERRLAEEGRGPEDATLQEMDAFWDEAKALEKAGAAGPGSD